MAKLKERGYNAERIVLEDRDISLGERCRRVNALCDKYGTQNCVFVSPHVNAAGRGDWRTARGWSGWVYTYGSQKSKTLANCLYDAALEKGLKIRVPKSDQHYWTAGFYVLKHTKCPACLTENLFMDNKDDVKYLLSEEGKKTIIDLHVDGIINYLYEVYK